MPKNEINISSSVHYEYAALYEEWEKFRYIERGGDTFVEKYVQQFSTAENSGDFANRKAITPVAGFAKAAIRDVINAIFQRMHAIRRSGGTESWQACVKGQRGGVDLNGSTMNHFLGTEVLPELLFMGKVGIYVDNFRIEESRSLAARGMQHPYLYPYRTEDIRNWEWTVKGDEVKLKKLLLRVVDPSVDPIFELINDWAEFYRYYWLEDGAVLCQQYDVNGSPIDLSGEASEFDPIELEISEIPFVLLQLQSSLLNDIANHQITLTNMESADAGWVLRSNIPVYTEQYDQKFEAAATWGMDDDTEHDDGKNKTTRDIGASDGVRYPIGAERPDFIAPPTGPLTGSMEKQRQLKDDIRTLSNLAVANTRSRFASAESKQMDERGLESGLSAIGMVLEHAERQIVALWSEYENSTEPAKIGYPERYSLRSDEDRRKDAEQLARTAVDVSSHTFRREVHKEIAEILLGGKIPDETLDQIMGEIDEDKYPTADPEQIRSDVEIGLVSRGFASVARGYPKGEAEKAKEEKIESELMRMKAQTPNFDNPAARGLEVDPEAAKQEKDDSQNPENDPDNIRRTRGPDQGQRNTQE